MGMVALIMMEEVIVMMKGGADVSGDNEEKGIAMDSF